MNDQAILLKIVRTWNISDTPEYRGFRCANCQKYRNRSWYHWLRYDGFIVPLHLCEEECHKKFERGELTFMDNPHYKRNPLTYTYSEKAREKFEEIILSWDSTQKPLLKAFTCDLCHNDLKVDPIDNLRKGYHVWYETKDNNYAELHFHKVCYELLGQKI